MPVAGLLAGEGDRLGCNPSMGYASHTRSALPLTKTSRPRPPDRKHGSATLPHLFFMYTGETWGKRKPSARALPTGLSREPCQPQPGNASSLLASLVVCAIPCKRICFTCGHSLATPPCNGLQRTARAAQWRPRLSAWQTQRCQHQA